MFLKIISFFVNRLSNKSFMLLLKNRRNFNNKSLLKQVDMNEEWEHY